MQTIDAALQIIDRLLEDAKNRDFSYVAITAGTIAQKLQEEAGAANHAMPTCCSALERRFRPGRDFFRRGRDRQQWLTSINADPSSTFEVLFEIKR